MGVPMQADSPANVADRLDRDLILDYLERQLLGPVDGPDGELEGEPPHRPSLAGILFPQEPPSPDELAEEIEDANTAGAAEDGLDDPIAMAESSSPVP